MSITAGTTYMASYYAPKGHYSVDTDFFYEPGPVGGNAIDTPPLRPFTPTEAAPTACTPTTASAAFPNIDGSGENYAVDVVFTPKLPPGA